MDSAFPQAIAAALMAAALHGGESNLIEAWIQLKREFRANESKENSLAFPWIPLAESGFSMRYNESK